MRGRVLPAVLGALAAMAPGATVPAAAVSSTALTIVHRPMVPKGVFNDQVQSTNWSGYAVTTTSATSVTGTWTQPTATCPRRGSTYASFWVGLDGYSSNSVEQLGTDSDCSHGSATYYAWYEMYPANSVSISSSTFPVSPGDSLTASVTRTGSSYTLTISDTTKNKQFSTTQSGTDQNASAEWVAEAPELCSVFTCSLASLTNFGTVNFSRSSAADSTNSGPIQSFTSGTGPHEITMVTSGGTVKAQPSGFTSGGDGFSVTWKHS